MTELVPDAFVPGLQTCVEVLSMSPGPSEKKLTAQQERAAVLGEHMQLRTRSVPELLRETGPGTAEIYVDVPPTRHNGCPSTISGNSLGKLSRRCRRSKREAPRCPVTAAPSHFNQRPVLWIGYSSSATRIVGRRCSRARC